VQSSLQALSALRSQLIAASEALLEASGTFSFDLQRSLFEAVMGELPVATWMAAFLALHGESLRAQVRGMLEEMVAGWQAFDRATAKETAAALEQSTTAGARLLVVSFVVFWVCLRSGLPGRTGAGATRVLWAGGAARVRAVWRDAASCLGAGGGEL
jgi:hypothetical protein